MSLCRASLLNAADALGAKSAIDGQLFLVRHLLILRDIARNVDLAQKDEPRTAGADAYSMTGWYILAYAEGTDGPIITDTLSSMLSRTSTLLPGALFTSLPGVRAEHLSDAKRVRNPPSALTSQPTNVHPGHRPRPKARLRDRHLDRLRAALRTPARIHRPPSLSRRSCRAGRRVPHRMCA